MRRSARAAEIPSQAILRTPFLRAEGGRGPALPAIEVVLSAALVGQTTNKGGTTIRRSSFEMGGVAVFPGHILRPGDEGSGTMLDLAFIREHPDLIKEVARRRKTAVDVDALLAIDSELRAVRKQAEELRAEQNRLSKAIQQAGSDKEARDGF